MRTPTKCLGGGVALLVLLTQMSCAASVEDIRAIAGSGNRQELFTLLADERSWVREEALLSLAGPGDPRLFQLLQGLALHPGEKPYVRAAAIEALGRSRDGAAFETISGLIAVPDVPSEIKIAAIRALCLLPQRNEALQLIVTLEQDEDVLVAALAEAKERSRCAD